MKQDCTMSAESRYASFASADFDRRFEDLLGRIACAVEEVLGDQLVALLLGGGYGRGEGAVVIRDGVESPYNDLDLTIVVQDPRSPRLHGLEEISHRFTAESGIDVDFSRPLAADSLGSLPNRLVWHELVRGHHVLSGPADLFRNETAATLSGSMDPVEAVRLLLNRGAGLLWALCVTRGAEVAPDEDFVRRNLYKAYLAMGDAILIAYGKHQTRYAGREAVLEELSESCETVGRLKLVSIYKRAAEFKLRPDEEAEYVPDSTTLFHAATRWGDVLLHVEGIRRGMEWPDLASYCASRHLREPLEHRPVDLARNCIRNLQMGRPGLRYPRERLYRSLPPLLGLAGELPFDWYRRSNSWLRVWRRFA